jgi:undecaprenyl-diphosphatase
MPGSNAIMPQSGPHQNGIECRNHASRWRNAESSICVHEGDLMLTLSRSANGWMYPFVPLVALPTGMSLVSLFGILAVAFAMERLPYWLAKRSVRRRRPAVALQKHCNLIVPGDEFSWPSGHTSAAFLVVTVLALAVNPAFAVLYVWAALAGFARVVVGVHFPSDVMAGAALGSTIGALVVAGQ